MKRSCQSHNSECLKAPKLCDINRKFSCESFCGYSEEELKDAVPADDAKLLESGDLTDVDALLARWWRRRSRDSSERIKSTTASASPSTRLRQICRFVGVKKF